MLLRLFLLALLCALPLDVRAAPPAQTATTIGANGSVDVTFTTGDTGETVAIKADSTSACGAYLASFHAATGGTASLWACPDATSTTSSGCQSLTAFTANHAGTLLNSAFRWIRVKIDAAPSAGTARMSLYCSQSASKSASPQGVTLANYGGSAPTNCAVQGDIHQDLDTGRLWICTIAATNTFIPAGREHHLSFSSTNLDSSIHVTPWCLAAQMPRTASGQGCPVGVGAVASNNWDSNSKYWIYSNRALRQTKLMCAFNSATGFSAGESILVTVWWGDPPVTGGTGDSVLSAAPVTMAFDTIGNVGGAHAFTDVLATSPYIGVQAVGLHVNWNGTTAVQVQFMCDLTLVEL